jgi:hypothetical protein
MYKGKQHVSVYRITDAPTASVTEMLNDLGWKTLQQRRKEARLTMMQPR